MALGDGNPVDQVARQAKKAVLARKAIGRLRQNQHRSLVTRLVDAVTPEDTSDTPERPLLPVEEPAPANSLDADPEARSPKALLKRQKATIWEEADLSALAVSDSDAPPCITNPRIWWRHPGCRLAAVWSILLLDFYIYGADPVQDSYVNYSFFGVFEDMFIIKWPTETKFKVIRITFTILCFILSPVVGHFVIHGRILRDCLGLQMFSGSQGSGVVSFLTFVVFFEYILPYPINYIESGTASEPITEDSVFKYYQWGKIWQSAACIADVLSITMITDTVLQDRTVWPDWGQSVKRVWNDAYNGWVRVLAPYFFLGVMAPLIIYGLWADDSRSNGLYTVEQILTAHLATTQWVRVLIAAILTMVDITTCLQDWEFPAYSSPAEFKVVGTFWSELDIPIFSQLFKRLFGGIKCIQPEFWENFRFRMSGKWLAYLPAFGALGADWWYLARTIFPYEPLKFAHYARPCDCLIFAIKDEDFIRRAYPRGVLLEEWAGNVTFEARQGKEPDYAIHSKFCDDSDFKKYAAFALGIGAGVAFIVLVFRAEYYWDRYSDRVDRDKVRSNLDEYNDEARASRDEE